MDEITAEIDTGIADFLTIKTLKPALFSFYYLKILMDVITTKILVLKTIISIERPDEFIAFFRNSPKSNGFFPFSEEESIFSYLLELNGWNVQVRIIRPVIQNTPSIIPQQVSRGSFLSSKVSSLVKKNHYLFNAGFIFSRFGLWQSVTAIMCSFLSYPPKPVMIYGSGYNWDYSLSAFFKAGIHPVYHLLSSTPDSDESTRATPIYTKIFEICKNSDKIRQYTLMSGIDTSSIIFEKIASIVSRSVVSCEKEYMRGKKIFEKTRVHCILVSTQAQHLDRAIIQAAHDQGIKVISWQHGGAGFCYHPLMYYAEFFNSDVHLVYGEGVKNSYSKTTAIMGIEKIPRFIAIGSSWLDREREIINTVNKTSPNSGSIVYITEKFQFNLYYNSTTFDSTEICDHFWVIQKIMLDFTKNHSNVPFVFKFHPADSKGEPARSYARKQNIDNVQFIVQEETIQDLIPKAQVIIIDFVSTSVLEAVLSDKPVFIYTGMYIMDNFPLTLLKKRAFLYDNFTTLLNDLEKFLIVGSAAFAQEHDVDYLNRDFIQSFGTYLDDGNSAKRAAEIIRSNFS